MGVFGGGGGLWCDHLGRQSEGGGKENILNKGNIYVIFCYQQILKLVSQIKRKLNK